MEMPREGKAISAQPTSSLTPPLTLEGKAQSQAEIKEKGSLRGCGERRRTVPAPSITARGQLGRREKTGHQTRSEPRLPSCYRQFRSTENATVT